MKIREVLTGEKRLQIVNALEEFQEKLLTEKRESITKGDSDFLEIYNSNASEEEKVLEFFNTFPENERNAVLVTADEIFIKRLPQDLQKKTQKLREAIYNPPEDLNINIGFGLQNNNNRPFGGGFGNTGTGLFGQPQGGLFGQQQGGLFGQGARPLFGTQNQGLFGSSSGGGLFGGYNERRN